MKKRTLFCTALLVFLVSYPFVFKGQDKQKHSKLYTQGLEKAKQVFTENSGQIPEPDIKFYGSTDGMDYYITKQGIEFVFRANGSCLPEQKEILSNNNPNNVPNKRLEQRMDLIFKNANPNFEILKEEESPTLRNYYLGNKNFTGVKSYSKIIYKSLYPGIDMVLYQINGKVRYDFIVHSGADPQNINILIVGADELKVLKSGTLRARNRLGELCQENLKVFQGNTIIKSSFKIHKNEISFNLGKYDKTKDLIIDPVVAPQWDWGTYCGGSDNDVINDLSIDVNANIYCIGTTQTNIYPGTATWSNFHTYGVNSTFLVSSYSSYYQKLAFFGKFKNDGTLLALTYYSTASSWNNSSPGTCTGASFGPYNGNNTGNTLTNYFDGTNTYVYGAGICIADPTPPTCNGSTDDIWLMKFNSDLTIATPSAGSYPNPQFIGGGAKELCGDIKCDAAGHIYLTGQASEYHTTKSPNASTRIVLGSFSSFSSTYKAVSGSVSSPEFDAFLIALSDDPSSGTYTLGWGTWIGGTSDDECGTALDIYEGTYYSSSIPYSLYSGTFVGVSGYTNSSSTLSGFSGSYSGGEDAFIGVFQVNVSSTPSSSSGGLIWGYEEGSSADDEGLTISHYKVSHTSYDDVYWYLGGYFTNSTPKKDAFIDQFIFDFSSATVNNISGFPVNFGSTVNDDMINGMVCDNSGNAYVVGYTESSSGIATNATTNNGYGDAFITKIDNTGYQIWGSYYGGSASDFGNAIAMDPCGNVFIGGNTYSTSGINNNPSSVSPWQSTNGGNEDGFIARFEDIDNTYAPVGLGYCGSGSINIGFSGNPTSAGWSYSWTQVSPSGSWTSTSANPSVSPSSTTTYQCVITSPTGCIKIDLVTVYFINACVAANSTYCLGSPATTSAGGGVPIMI